MKLKHLFLFVAALAICLYTVAKNYTVTSPDGWKKTEDYYGSRRGICSSFNKNRLISN